MTLRYAPSFPINQVTLKIAQKSKSYIYLPRAVVQPVEKNKNRNRIKETKRKKNANETKFALLCSFIQFSLRVFLSFNDASFYNFVTD